MNKMLEEIRPGRVAIVTTVRGCPDGMLHDFLCYHLALGFDRVIVFFDDPNDVDIPMARKFDRVSVILNGKELQNLWAKSRLYKKLGGFRNAEVMARQLLNTDVAIDMARSKGLEWILPIDSDELWYSSSNVSVQAHYAELSRRGFNQAVYLNVEGVPDVRDQGRDFFREINVFKRSQISFSIQAHSTAQQEWLSSKGIYQQGYFVGKAAGRVTDTNILPLEVTRFFIVNEKRAVFDDPCLLHFVNPSPNAAAKKYSILGPFSDLTWDRKTVDPEFKKYESEFPPESGGLQFHLHMRDVARNGLSALVTEFNRVTVLDMRSAQANRWKEMGLLLSKKVDWVLDACGSTPLKSQSKSRITVERLDKGYNDDDNEDDDEECPLFESEMQRQNLMKKNNPKKDSSGNHGLINLTQCLNQPPTKAGRTDHVHCFFKDSPHCCAAIKQSRGTLKIPDEPY